VKTLVSYFRSLFCKHEWECLQDNEMIYQEIYENPLRHVWVYKCKKCGYKKQITSA
jgi:hypothetical protein